MRKNGHISKPSSVLAGRVAPGPVRSFFPRLRAAQALDIEDLTRQIRKTWALQYALHFIGQPYRWGGDDPIHGFDCSGLVIEILTAAGIVPHGYDATAGGLMNHLEAQGAPRIPVVKAGAIVFFKNAAGEISHVELGLPGMLLLGASGGGSTTDDLEDAAARNAFVKIRPFGYRREQTIIVDPFASQGRKDRPMTLRNRLTKAKAAAADVVAIIAAALGFLPGLFKKKPFTLWQWDPVRKAWIDHGTYSARQCRKLQAELVRLGQDPATFTIMRKGAKPPAEGPK